MPVSGLRAHSPSWGPLWAGHVEACGVSKAGKPSLPDAQGRPYGARSAEASLAEITVIVEDLERRLEELQMSFLQATDEKARVEAEAEAISFQIGQLEAEAEAVQKSTASASLVLI